MKHLDAPRGDIRTLYSPMVGVILQGAKQITIGSRSTVLKSGDTFVLSNSVPAAGAIIQASRQSPYVAAAVKIDTSLLAQIASEIDISRSSEGVVGSHCLYSQTADSFIVDCMHRLVRLLDHPEAASVLRWSIMRELHYWLLCGGHGSTLRALVNVNSRAGRLEQAISLLRTQYSLTLSAKRLAEAAGMSLTSFHFHFKQLTAMTPRQYQKQIRLLEARRLMRDEGKSATEAAYLVGYESASQFSREYSRMFKLSPKQDAMAARARSLQIVGGLPATD